MVTVLVCLNMLKFNLLDIDSEVGFFLLYVNGYVETHNSLNLI